MSNFAVGLPELQQSSRASRSTSAELGEQLRRLRHDAADVVTGSWQGRAAAAFDRAFLAWDEGAREVVEALDRLGELLALTEYEYAYRDDASSGELHRASGLR